MSDGDETSEGREIPICVSYVEGGDSAVEPVRGTNCPVCGNESFYAASRFYGKWSPRSAAESECGECGTVFELYARPADGDDE